MASLSANLFFMLYSDLCDGLHPKDTVDIAKYKSTKCFPISLDLIPSFIFSISLQTSAILLLYISQFSLVRYCQMNFIIFKWDVKLVGQKREF